MATGSGSTIVEGGKKSRAGGVKIKYSTIVGEGRRLGSDDLRKEMFYLFTSLSPSFTVLFDLVYCFLFFFLSLFVLVV